MYDEISWNSYIFCKNIMLISMFDKDYPNRVRVQK